MNYRPSPSFIVTLIILAVCFFLIPVVGDWLSTLYVRYM